MAPPTDPRASLVLDGGRECAALRRTLGATAWFVLEELALLATANGDGQLLVQVSTRGLAEALGLNKDTVTRALARLRESHCVGVVSRNGSVGAARYSVHAPGLTRLASVNSDTPTPATTKGPARPRLHRRHIEATSQLSLLE
ncbi:MAG: hypothetical protein ABI658_31905 [Acidimicrobiales bacterium]